MSDPQKPFVTPALLPVPVELGTGDYAVAGIDPELWITPARRRRTLDVRRAAAEARMMGVHPADVFSSLLGGDYTLADQSFDAL